MKTSYHKQLISTFSRCLPIIFLLLTTTSSGFYLSGNGHYGLRWEYQSAQNNTQESAHNAIQHTFHLLGEVRHDEQLAFFVGLRLFPSLYDSYLGSTATNKESVDPIHPQYKDLDPKVDRAFIRYKTSLCTLEAGRRGRDWGLGIFLDSGAEPFAKQASLFDGVSCHVNIQGIQTLGFAAGYDQLAEKMNTLPSEETKTYSSNLRQLFVSIEYDDRKQSPKAFLQKQIGIYGSQTVGSNEDKTSLWNIDLYLNFLLPTLGLNINNELLITTGKTNSYASQKLGGDNLATNEMKTNAAFAGNIEWLITNPSTSVDTKEKKQYHSHQHSLKLQYAYAPGEENGYYDEDDNKSALYIGNRSANTHALSLHPNYNLGMLLFNGHNYLDHLAFDGVFNPSAIMNATAFALTYAYKDHSIGNIEATALYAVMNKTMPEKVKNHYTTQQEKKVGYYGSDLGIELNVKYSREFGSGVLLGAGAGALAAGKAWQVKDNEKPLLNYFVQAYATFTL